MKSFMASPSTIEREWYVVDATGHTLGRLASEVASVLRGKNKPQFTPHVDTGDYVIVVNAEKIKVTGKKLDQKIYYNHSDYVGGMKETTLKEMLAKHPERVVMRTQYGFGEMTMKWGELDAFSDKLAYYLTKELRTNKPIIVYGHKHPMMLVCFLAVSYTHLTLPTIA